MKRETRIAFEDQVDALAEKAKEKYPNEDIVNQVAFMMVELFESGNYHNFLDLIAKGMMESLQGHKRVKLADLLAKTEQVEHNGTNQEIIQ